MILLLYVTVVYVFWTKHCNIIIQEEAMRCTFPKLIFSFFCCIQHVLNLRVHLQEDGCLYSFGMVLITCISVRSQVGR
jgi:hypothetical protein